MAAMTLGHGRFRGPGQRPLFDTVYGSGLDKNRYPELKAAFESVEQAFGACVRDICGANPSGADALATALEATAHGHA